MEQALLTLGAQPEEEKQPEAEERTASFPDQKTDQGAIPVPVCSSYG